MKLIIIFGVLILSSCALLESGNSRRVVSTEQDSSPGPVANPDLSETALKLRQIAIESVNRAHLEIYQCFVSVWAKHGKRYISPDPACIEVSPTPMIPHFKGKNQQINLVPGQIIRFTTASYRGDEIDAKILSSLEHAMSAQCHIDATNDSLVYFKYLGCSKIPLTYFEK